MPASMIVGCGEAKCIKHSKQVMCLKEKSWNYTVHVYIEL